MLRLLSTCAVLMAAAAGCKGSETFVDAGGDDDAPADASASCEMTACGGDDGCCPSACNANNDPDCEPVCGNEVVEGTELCDPDDTCASSCPAVGCQLRELEGGPCEGHCELGDTITACVDNDDCCPDGCNETNDLECASVCDNGVIESGEECDPLATCPTSCPAVECQLYQAFELGTCQAECVPNGTITACSGGTSDDCCPGGCNANNDTDCEPFCGNSVIEGDEICDGNCPTCPSEPVSCWGPVGSASTCDLVCHQPVIDCGANDGCCAYKPDSGGAVCDSATDGNCAGTGWRAVKWPTPISWNAGQCTIVTVYGLVAGDSVAFTTCWDPAQTDRKPIGDTKITKIQNHGGDLHNYFPTLTTINDNPTGMYQIPILHGWRCENFDDERRMSTAPENTGGVILVGSASTGVDVTICAVSGEGNGDFYIWWNGTSDPSPG